MKGAKNAEFILWSKSGNCDSRSLNDTTIWHPLDLKSPSFTRIQYVSSWIRLETTSMTQIISGPINPPEIWNHLMMAYDHIGPIKFWR